jgi:hypothetical protein
VPTTAGAANWRARFARCSYCALIEEELSTPRHATRSMTPTCCSTGPRSRTPARHIREEEDEIFPRIEASEIDLDALRVELQARRAEPEQDGEA